MASPGLKRGVIQHFMASFEEFPCTSCRDEVVGCRVSSVQRSFFSQKQFYNPQLTASPSLVEQHSVYILGQVDEKKLEDIRNASSDVITFSLKLTYREPVIEVAPASCPSPPDWFTGRKYR